VTLQSSTPHHDHGALFQEEELWEISDSSSAPESGKESMHPPVLSNTNYGFTLDELAAKVATLELKYPIFILPPKPNNGVWTVRSMPQQRHQRITLHFDQHSGEQIMRIGFEDHHPVQQFVSHGISLHEGALFGWLNQALALLTAFGLIALSCLGISAWWKRRPKGKLAAPQKTDQALPRGLIVACVLLGVFLPSAGLSFIAIIVFEKLRLFFARPMLKTQTT
jgi:uncharacterized iron-regulated membrane protein